MNIVNLIKQIQSEYSVEHPKYFVFDEVLNAISKRYKEDPDRDPEILASKLIQSFQNYSIDIPNHKRYEYAIFSSLQHLNLIVNHKMELEDINYYLQVMDQISKRQGDNQ